MESVQQPAPNHRVVHLESRSPSDSEVMVELHISKAPAGKLAHLEAARIAALDLGTACPATEFDGSTAPAILTSITAVARVNERERASDQQDFINHIETKLDAMRAEANLLRDLPATREIPLEAVDDLIRAAYDYRRGGADFTDRMIAAAAERPSADTLYALDRLDGHLRATAVLPEADT